DENANRADVISLRDKVTVEVHNKPDPQDSEVIIDMADGRSFALGANVGIPASDLDAQWEKLTNKFHAISDPVVGQRRARELATAIRNLESLENFSDLGPLLRAG
ncbi:MAG: hypothetical protein ACLGGZ_07235, partial [Alphaproteobacteria bacterium]